MALAVSLPVGRPVKDSPDKPCGKRQTSGTGTQPSWTGFSSPHGGAFFFLNREKPAQGELV